jgi:outer membrane receptor protein involved in Fe transport
VDDVPVDARVNINSKQEVVSVFVSDLVSLTPDTHLTLSARANHVRVSTLDNIHPSGNIESLTARHRFSSLNPAIGLVMGIAPKAQFYAGFNQTNRTPTAIELGCANPERPCRLPNAMQSDPPLKQVLAQNLELGVRGQLAHSSWRAGVFHTLSKNDILFVADDQSGYGYFKNFGKTRRQGVELGLNSKLGALSLGANYSYIDATFRSHEQVNGGSNSSNEGSGPGLEGNIDIKPGNKIPLTPAHQFKFNLGYQFTPEWSVNNQVLAFSSQYARGNENNAHVADGKYYQGAGKVAGYALWNLDSTYQVSKNWGVHFGIHNLLDRRYATAGQLGVNAFNAAGNYQARPYAAVNGEYPLNHTLFLAPGAPRQFYLHLNFTF